MLTRLRINFKTECKNMTAVYWNLYCHVFTICFKINS